MVIGHHGDPTEIRTRDTTVKGWCLNRLTIGPYKKRLLKYIILFYNLQVFYLMVAGAGFEPTTFGL